MGYYYGRRNRNSSIFDAFTLNPLPYPVLLILAVISIFLGISWYSSYESAVEAAEEQINWVLFATPVLILLIVRWLSSMDNPEKFFFGSPCDQRRRTHHQPSDGTGGSPWGVAALIVLLLVLVQYQSVFLDNWLV